MRTKHFKDLIVWQKAMLLAKNVYANTNAFPKDELFGLRSQLRRAAVSVPSNIAEGHGRLSDKVFRVFLGHARGSLHELETQLLLSQDLGFLAHPSAQKLVQDCNEVARLLNGLLRSLKPSKKLPPPPRS